jgi:hypothetical protein
MKKKVLKRVPPGDRWAEFKLHLTSKNEEIRPLQSL